MTDELTVRAALEAAAQAASDRFTNHIGSWEDLGGSFGEVIGTHLGVSMRLADEVAELRERVADLEAKLRE